MRHIIAIHLQNEAGALTRVTGLISTRGYNIESLSVAPPTTDGVARHAGDHRLGSSHRSDQRPAAEAGGRGRRRGHDGRRSLARELMLIKLQVRGTRRGGQHAVPPPGGEGPVAQALELHRGLTGTEAEVSEFIADAGSFGEIVEVVRSGVLGISRTNPRLHLVK